MNTWQVAQQLKNLLESATWPDGDADSVFGTVRVVPEEQIPQALTRTRAPLALISVGRGDPDDDDPGLIEQTYRITLVVTSKHGLMGESSILGGPRVGGQGGSQGRGILEVEEELFSQIKTLERQNGVFIRSLYRGSAGTQHVTGMGYVASREYDFQALHGLDRHYPPPTRLAGTDQGSGTVDLTWSLPPDRFDRDSVVLRRASGATAPSSVTGGTGVTLGSDLATSVTDAPGSGQWSYALFAGYDEYGNGSPDRYSDADTLTVTLA